ncbi:MAG: histidine kinase [Treponema sp.]|nr:histidine kinase [Treponema sp.]
MSRRTAAFRKSLRAKILLSVILAMTVMGMFFFMTTSLNRTFLLRTGRSYETNERLGDISAELLNTEVALENYMAYRTFESIDSYYQHQNLADALIQEFDIRPSTDRVKLSEYKVYNLSQSFFSYSRTAVTAQRAKNFELAKESYTTSLECYSLLQKETEKLNSLLMEQNASLYRANQTSFNKFFRLSTGIIFVFSILVFIILYLTLTILMKPLTNISEVAMRIAIMDFEVPLFNSQSEDEVGNICRAFDRMIVSIQAYIDKIWEKVAQENEMKEKELEMRELYSSAQLRVLQNQINPHFLFNTLNTGAQLAMMEGADKTCYFIEQVADFFRYNIQQQGTAASLEEELSLVDNFVYIMKVRFGERLAFVKELPEDADYSVLLPRMILQPLVENCIKYGLKEDRGHVILNVEQTVFDTTITISDNGGGMSEEQRRAILAAAGEKIESQTGRKRKEPAKAPPKASAAGSPGNTAGSPGTGSTGTGTGLVNVASRLRLYFHRADVFDIQQNEEGGTSFILKIPRLGKKDSMHEEKHEDR